MDTLVADDPPTIVIMNPYSGKVAPFMTETRPGLFRVEYRPTKLGTHNIVIQHNGKHIPSSPFKCDVFDPKSVQVTDLVRVSETLLIQIYEPEVVSKILQLMSPSKPEVSKVMKTQNEFVLSISSLNKMQAIFSCLGLIIRYVITLSSYIQFYCR